MPRYDHQRIEPKWQKHWDDHQTFQTPNPPLSPPLDQGGTQGGAVAGKDKLFVLDMFPYPSGDGLHVGHPEGYTATDIVCRFNRMRGRNVLHPMGWDAFGLPAEQHAINTGTHPRITTEKNIGTFRRQLKMLGFSYDWSREFSTTDPEYYRWTQWIFLQLFDTWYDPDHEWTDPNGKQRTGKGRPVSELPVPEFVKAEGEEAVRRYQDKHRLAYQHEAPVNWCPALGTVLSNEEVNAEGLSERGNHPVTRIPLRQWMLRITAYADRLIDDLDDLDWSDSVKALQRNWIGKSEGAEVDFFIGRDGADKASGRREPAGNADQTERDETSADHRGADTPRSPDFYAQWKAVREGAGFPETPTDDVIRIYTTRPDTLFGATYMVLAPEHPFVKRLTTPEHKDAVENYCREASFKSDLDRTDLAKDKSGVFTGSFAVNPVNGERIPIWIADYVLISYGTGAIMAVPGQDERDWEFAEKFGLPILRTVQPPPDFDGKAFTGDGPAIHSELLNGLHVAEAKAKIITSLEKSGLGTSTVNYRLRDWLFSRQHFWGEPFPVWHELDADGNMAGLMRTDAEDELPVTLPENFDFQPHGRPEPPLDEAPVEWLYKTAPDGVKLKRETNSMPQWAGSCWYYLRFCDPKNEERFIDPDLEKYWMPVDLYIGGAEHAVLHLLYSRFWHKVLFDHGHVSTSEPFNRLVNQGMILGEPTYEEHLRQDENGENTDEVISADQSEREEDEHGTAFGLRDVPIEDVEIRDNKPFRKDTDILLTARAYKMSKSRGNVINPDDIVERYGADALRMYEMFMGPLEQMKPWSMSGVEGVSRFIGRVWRMVIDHRADPPRSSLDKGGCWGVLNAAVQDAEPTDDQLRVLHRTIKSVTEDIEKLSFNTAISRMMEFTNALTQCDVRPRSVIEPFVLLLSPFAPHLAEELWQTLGHEKTLAYEPWPEFDSSKIAESTIEIPVQINGKVRSKITVAADANQSTLQQTAEADPDIQKHLAGKQVVKVIVVPGRMVNFVAKG